MISDTAVIRRRKGHKEFWIVAFVAVLFLLLYVLLYLYLPFSEFVNNLLSNFLIVTAATACALLATFVRKRYQVKDSPRNVWVNLEIALWLWALAELIWAFYNMTYGEVGLSPADFFWIFAYGFLFAALFLQYRILFRPSQSEARWAVALLGVLVLSLTLASAWVLNRYANITWDKQLIIDVFYPAADIVIATAALYLAYRFQAGALSYPWLGLFVFTFADLLYAWLDLTGIYAWSINQGNVLSAISDATYFAAYLAVGLGCYAQWLLLRYGPIFTGRRKP